MNRRKVNLKGMTMPELLVTMIIAGILFLSVMEGFGLFKRYASVIAGRVSGNTELYDSYYSVSELIAGADGMFHDGNTIAVYSGGAPIAYLHEADSSIVVVVKERCDTVFHRAVFERLTAEPQERLDSLVIVAVHDGEDLRFSFQVNTPVEIVLQETAEEQESDYGYE